MSDIELLNRLVDWTHLYALEGESWPDHKTITQPLIRLSGLRAPTQADADRLKAGATLKQLLETEHATNENARSDAQLPCAGKLES